MVRGVQGAVAHMVEVMRGAFASPALQRLQLGLAGSALWQWSSLVVLSVYAYDQGGAAAVGIVGLAKMLPAALLTPLTGMLADRFARRDVLLGSALTRTLLAAAIAVAVAAGLPLWAITVIAVAQTIAGNPYRPAQAALLPQLAKTPQQMAAANAVWNGIENAAFIVGAVVGGWALATFAPEIAFAVIAIIGI